MADDPPPYHDWTSGPDTLLFPPPPLPTSDYSSTTNASYDEAAAAHRWCASHPVYNPQAPSRALLEAVRQGHHTVEALPNSNCTIKQLSSTLASSTKYLISAPPSRHSFDQVLQTKLPLYFASTHNPLLPNSKPLPRQPYTIFFTIEPCTYTKKDSTVSIGFAAKPYPPNRQPGWHRASIGVHGDDGRRYVNDSWGGVEFCGPFKLNETIGFGMTFLPQLSLVAPQLETDAKAGGRGKVGEMSSYREINSSLPRCKVTAFLTRDGKLEGHWDIDEERDSEHDEGVAGLRGEVDLYAAIGIYGRAEVELTFYDESEQLRQGQSVLE